MTRKPMILKYKFLFKDQDCWVPKLSFDTFKTYKYFILKKKNQRKGIFRQTDSILFCSKHRHKLLVKVIFSWNEVKNQKLQTFIFKMKYYT